MPADRELTLETGPGWVLVYPPGEDARRAIVWASDRVELGIFRHSRPEAADPPAGLVRVGQAPTDNRDPVLVPAGWALLARRDPAAVLATVTLVASPLAL